ncbi:MAG: hypothetical protein ACLQBB_09285 [Solirubrobacteraceae bacterium]
MSKLRLAVCLALILVATSAAAALAAHPLSGRVYAGLTNHEKLTVTLTVSKNGRTVKVNVPYLPLYCQGGGGPVMQVSKPATVSSGGSFKGSITYVFEGKDAYRGSFKGSFVTKNLVKGTLRSEYKGGECDGSTTFTAKPAGAV